MAKRLVLPKRYIRIDSGPTTFVMQKRTGFMMGRKRGGKRNDGTRVRRVIKDVDVDKDGKIDFHGGSILGRTKAIKSSKRAKGYVRRI